MILYYIILHFYAFSVPSKWFSLSFVVRHCFCDFWNFVLGILHLWLLESFLIAFKSWRCNLSSLCADFFFRASFSFIIWTLLLSFVVSLMSYSLVAPMFSLHLHAQQYGPSLRWLAFVPCIFNSFFIDFFFFQIFLYHVSLCLLSFSCLFITVL